MGRRSATHLSPSSSPTTNSQHNRRIQGRLDLESTTGEEGTRGVSFVGGLSREVKRAYLFLRPRPFSSPFESVYGFFCGSDEAGSVFGAEDG